MKNQQQTSLIDLNAACAILNLSRSTIYRLIKDEVLKTFRYNQRGKHYFKIEDLNELQGVSS
tara:strand:+ start:1141 stop:1326 length:186 start_codon:yes stop_codon:yes gene_type:complete